MLQVTNLGLTLSGNTILSDINLTVSNSDLVVVIGQNGSGKTSLLRCITGWSKATAGRIEFTTQPLHTLTPLERAALVAALPQRPNMSEPIPVREIVASARYRFSESRRTQRQQTAQILRQNDIEHLADRLWNHLSGGEAQRVALASLVAQDAALWLMDEPANHLDPAVQQEIYQRLTGYWRQGKTMMVITHNLNLILGAVEPAEYHRVRIVGIDTGRIAFSCTLDAEQLIDEVSALYALPVQRISVFDRHQLVFGARR